ncbi:MAG: hypothetical protein A3D31_09490 [Candidatus Fluviicola riflensis]|nr:MAG: hypothetical protein CHH17_13900 [Candidatus Fluviicola riflensis]OGS77240.1 MAG: hypothetical protein A3D31_09490 [Candidatus Fluviicola riflensis]OGS82175.1 MAG: hypothetical protein A2724_18435 [Fluviicola sp. RIFCSPHIGHO2_01_FULL_43_53]OGS87869.1 MAG: hypothetical protein A3E30_15870 [Fluviicola sp. RIFCSPHIGHO2_12_FULL_43_24]
MRSLNRKALLVAAIGFMVAGCLHLLNAWVSDLPQGIHHTADDPSYLAPVENWLANGTWKDNSAGASSYVQRPPLMGIIHGVFYGLFGSKSAIITFIFLLLIHSVALYRLPALLQHFVPEKTSYYLAYLYALTPCFWGFLSYQITEAISPTLLLLLLSVRFNDQRNSIFWVVFLLTCIWFLRPVLVLLAPVFLVFLWKRRANLISFSNWKNPLIVVLSLLAIVGWETRKAGYMGEWGNPHPIYHVNNQSLFRPAHASLSNVFRVWETRPEVIHRIAGSCWTGDSTARSLASLELYVRERSIPIPAPELHRLLAEYHAVNQIVLHQIEAGRLRGETTGEKQIRIQFDALAEKLAKENRFQYHLRTPLISMKELFKKSQLNLELFQLHYRGNLVVEGLRWFCVILLNLLFLGTFLLLFGKNNDLKWLALGAILYCFYLFYVQRANEDRYMVPMLPLVFIGGCSFWWKVIFSKRRKAVQSD